MTATIFIVWGWLAVFAVGTKLTVESTEQGRETIMIGIRGNSFSNGAGNPNGPLALGQSKGDAGLACRPVTFWDFVEGRDPELLP